MLSPTLQFSLIDPTYGGPSLKKPLKLEVEHKDSDQPRFLVEDIADCAKVVQDLLSRVEEIRDSLSGEGAYMVDIGGRGHLIKMDIVPTFKLSVVSVEKIYSKG